MRPIEDALASMRRVTRTEPAAVVVLAPGTETLARRPRLDATLPFGELLGEREAGPASSAQWAVGRWSDVPVAVMHRGASGVGFATAAAATVLRATRLLAAAPPPLLILGTCASLDPLSEPGEVALLEDHVDLTGRNPLAGPNLDGLGVRFPDMSRAYDERLREAALAVASERGIPLRRGVYVAVSGPQRPTRAEYRMYRRIGGDFVGNGIAPEVIVARHMDMPVLALLAVAGVHAPDAVTTSDDSGAEPALERARERVAQTIEALLTRLAAMPDPVA